MKKFTLAILSVCVACSTYALDVVSTAGGLSTAITTAGGDLTTVTELKVTGVIDARDFKTMRDDMTALTTIDLSAATVTEYTGTEGTQDANSRTYPADETPYRAFRNNTKITQVLLPATLKVLGERTFEGCSYLSSLAIPEGVTSLGAQSLQNCSRMTSLSLPASLASIGSIAFNGCSGIQTITLAEGSNYFSVLDNALFNKDQTALLLYPLGSSATTYIVPATVTTIGERAFAVSSKLITIILPNSLEAIEGNAFLNCSKLTSIAISGAVTSIATRAFYGCSQLKNIIVDQSTPLSAIISDVFDGGSSYKAACTLYVPEGKETDYSGSETTAWTGFGTYASINDLFVLSDDEAVINPVGETNQSITITLDPLLTTLGIGCQLSVPEEDNWLTATESGGVVSLIAGSNDGVSRNTTVTVSVMSANNTQDITVSQDFYLGLNDARFADLNVFVQNNELIVSGAAVGDAVTLYNLLGEIVLSEIAASENVNIPIPAKGVFIVKVGNKTAKFTR